MKLNLGCGRDIMPGWTNVDAAALPGVDQIADLTVLAYATFLEWEKGKIEEVKAFDILEHMHHWEAMQFLRDIFAILRKGGKLNVRVPDSAVIISTSMTVDQKLTRLFGGQDVPQPNSDTTMNELRKTRPDLFCHRYGWWTLSLSKALNSVGFKVESIRPDGNLNIIAICWKP